MTTPSYPTTVAEVAAATRIHHEFSMSKLNYLDDCPGFKNRQSEDTTASDEGQELHNICQYIVEAWANETSLDFDALIDVTLQGQAKHLKPEQAESVRQALAPVKEPLTNWAEEVYTEEKIEIFTPSGDLLTAGFADVVLIGKKNGLLWAIVIDWKFGRKVVRDATNNLQGWGYGYGVLQKLYGLAGFTSVFVQPRVQDPTSCDFYRTEMGDLYGKILRTIEWAKNPESPRKVNDNCVYCAHVGTCTAQASYNTALAINYNMLPAIKTFHGSEITDPGQMALALFAVKRAEPAIKSVKAAAIDMARNGHHLAAVWGTGPDAFPIEFELKDRKAATRLGEAPLVFEELKDVIDYPLFIGCVDVRWTDLQERYAMARIELANSRNEKLPNGKKFTKVAALAELQKRLDDAGLISRADDDVHYLKEIKHKPQTTQQNEQSCIEESQ